jgi:hypothetical protein
LDLNNKLIVCTDDCNDLLSFKLNNGDKLLATREIGNYWSEKLPKKSIYIIVELPVLTTSLDEMLKLREEVTLLKKKFSKSEYGMCKIVGMAERHCK